MNEMNEDFLQLDPSVLDLSDLDFDIDVDFSDTNAISAESIKETYNKIIDNSPCI